MINLWSASLQSMTFVPRLDFAKACHDGTVAWLAPLLVVGLVTAAVLAWLVTSLSRRRAHAATIALRPYGGAGYWLFVPPLLATLYFLDSERFIERSVPPPDAMEVRAIAANGNWTFLYPNEKQQSNRLVVPNARPIRLLLTSSSNIQNFCVREYGVHGQAVIGRYSSVWFTPSQLGDRPIDCGFLNGADARPVLARKSPEGGPRLSVLDPAAFDTWLNDSSKEGSPQ